MKRTGFALAGLVALAATAGCAEVVTEPALTDEALRGGCHWDCPPCPPNEPCSLAPCVLICSGNGGVPCGPTVCRNGDVCCNYSCGICTPPDGFCTEQYCEAPPRDHICTEIGLCVEGFHWSDTQCRCMRDHNPTNGCTSDADCSAWSDYCDGCNCVPLATGDNAPSCPDNRLVSCFADPCMNQTAVCDVATGECVLADAATSSWVDPATL